MTPISTHPCSCNAASSSRAQVTNALMTVHLVQAAVNSSCCRNWGGGVCWAACVCMPKSMAPSLWPQEQRQMQSVSLLSDLGFCVCDTEEGIQGSFTHTSLPDIDVIESGKSSFVNMAAKTLCLSLEMLDTTCWVDGGVCPDFHAAPRMPILSVFAAVGGRGGGNWGGGGWLERTRVHVSSMSRPTCVSN